MRTVVHTAVGILRFLQRLNLNHSNLPFERFLFLYYIYMKNLIITLFISVFLVSCLKTHKYEYELEGSLPIEELVNNLVKEQPNFDFNEAAEKIASDELRKRVHEEFKTTNLIKDIPLHLLCVNRVGNKNLAFFTSVCISRASYKHGIDRVDFNLIGEVGDSIARLLTENEYYCIDGKFVKFIDSTYEAIMMMKSMKLETKIKGYERAEPNRVVAYGGIGIHKYNAIKVDLGNIYFKIDSIKSGLRRNKIRTLQ